MDGGIRPRRKQAETGGNTLQIHPPDSGPGGIYAHAESSRIKYLGHVALGKEGRASPRCESLTGLPLTGDDHVITSDQNRSREAELGDLRGLIVGMWTRLARVSNEPIDRLHLDLRAH